MGVLGWDGGGEGEVSRVGSKESLLGRTWVSLADLMVFSLRESGMHRPGVGGITI